MIISLGFINFFSIALVSQAANPQWTVDKDSNESFVEYRLKTSPSIYYRFSPQSGEILANRNIFSPDSGRMAAAPGWHLWGPHPEKIDINFSLEKHFIEILSENGWEFADRSIFLPRITFDLQTQKWKPRDMRKVLEENLVKTFPSDTKAFYKKIESSVNETRRNIFPLIDWRIVSPWREKYLRLDVIEPLMTEVSHNEVNFDAFLLFPMKTYLKYGKQLSEALQDFSLNGLHFPIEWMISRKNIYPLDVRVCVLILLTHNHNAEDTLIRLIAEKDGIAAAYDFSILLSEAYFSEAKYWAQFPSSTQINVSPKIRIFAPLTGFESSSRRNTSERISFEKRYHYYGAFAIAYRLATEWKVDRQSLKDLVEALGYSYRIKTTGFDRTTLNEMSQLYRTGSEHFMRLRESLD